MKAHWVSTLITAAACLLVSCSSNSRTLLTETSPQPVGTGDVRGLPFPADAPPGPRAASIAGAAAYELQLDQILGSRHASYDQSGMQLDSQAEPAWAMYMINGFDGDMFPVSAHVEVASGAAEYLVGLPDFDNGRWIWAGPYSGSADVDIPLPDGVNHGRRLVSRFGNSFVAVVSQDPAQLLISAIQLEVFGGSAAPAPPTELRYLDDGDGILLSWYPSPDADRPDFNGYLLERAPFNSGNYSEVMHANPAGSTFRDEGVVPLSIYRYRLRAIDSAGNLSLGTYQFGASCGNGSNDVVAVLKLPAGPLLGPADVLFDMSDSYVSGDGSPDNYELFVDGYPAISGPSSSYSLNLQPGCYQVLAIVHSAALSDFAVGYLRVLPQWQDQSVLVDDMPGNMGTMLYARSGRLPDGSLVHAGYDSALGVIAVWTETPAGLRYHAFFAGDNPVEFSCEPVLSQGVLNFGFASSGSVQVITVDRQGSSRLLQNIIAVDDQFCLTRDEQGRLGMFRQIDNGGNFDLVYSTVESISTYATVLGNVNGGVHGLDAVWNPTLGAFDICYGDGVSLNYEQWEPVGGHIAGGGLYNFKVLGVDLELDPVSQRSVMLTTLDVAPFEAWYMYQDDNGFWSLPEKPDAGLKATAQGDLAVDADDAYVLLQVKDGADDYLRSYRRDAGNWPLLSEELVSSGVESGLSLLPDADGGLLAALPLKDGTCTLEHFPESGSPAVEYVVGRQSDGYHGELHATSGSDGLHAIWLNEAYDELEHFSSTDGAAWNDNSPAIGKVTDLDIASTSAGEVYLSYVDVNSTELSFWDGSGWVLQKNYPGVEGYRPSLMSQPTNELMYWYVHLQPANAMRFVEGNQATPFSYVSVNPPDRTYLGTVMDGGFSFAGIKPRWFCLIGSSLVNSSLAFYDYNNMTASDLSLHQNSNSQKQVWGRTLDSCLFASPDGDRQCVWMTNAAGVMDSVRLSREAQSNTMQPTSVPVADPFEALIQTGIRYRSVNMAQAHGRTALALDCGLLGYDNKLFWSNFGDFQQLAAPRQIDPAHGAAVMSPEIVVGMDGRWHILYIDLPTGQMRCISTI